MLELHSTWFAGLSGRLFGGLIALLTLIALVIGLVIYAPYVRRLRFGAIRRDRGARVVQLDYHNWVGVVVFGWAMVVSVTGLLLSAASILLLLWQVTELKAMTTAPPAAATVAPAATIDQALAAAAAARPARRLGFAFLPGAEYAGEHHYTAVLYGREAYATGLFEIAAVEARSGRVDAVRPLPPYLQAIALAELLHFGDYGGLPLKLLWLGSALGTLAITANGAWQWWAKRRQRCPAPVAAALALEHAE